MQILHPSFLLIKEKNMFQLGVHAIISIIIYLIAIGLSFQAMKAVQLEKIIRKGHVFETQLLYLSNLF